MNYDKQADNAMKTAGKMAGSKAKQIARKQAVKGIKKILVKLGAKKLIAGRILLPLLKVGGVIFLKIILVIFIIAFIIEAIPFAREIGYSFTSDGNGGTKIERNVDVEHPLILAYGHDENWTSEDDKELYNRYLELVESYDDGLAEEQGLEVEVKVGSEKDQVKQHKLPWGFLASADRLAGDPTIHRESSDFEPRPEKLYEILKPEFTWKEKDVTIEIEYTVEQTFSENAVSNPPRSDWHSYEVETYVRYHRWDPDRGENVPVPGRRYIAKVIKDKTVNETITVLDNADTVEGYFKYEYEITQTEKEEFSRDEYYGVDTDDIINITINEPKVDNIEMRGGELLKYTKALEENNIKPLPGNIDFALKLTTAFQPELEYDLHTFGGVYGARGRDLSVSYWDGEEGEIHSPLPANWIRNKTSPFGYRNDPFTRERRFHSGVDIAAPTGTDLYAFNSGIVVYRGSRGGYGNTVIICHGNYQTLYAHMHTINVRLDEEVAPGDKIGEIGSTGRSSGPHLHFEIRKLWGDGGFDFVNPWPSIQEIIQNI